MVISIGILALMITLIGGSSFPLTEGAELEMSSNIKIAPYMDLETGLYGFIDTEGQIIIEPKYQYAESFSEGVAVIAESGSSGTYYGYIDRKGDIILPLKYEYARGFHEGLAMVSEKGNILVINKSGEVSYKLPDNMVVSDYGNGMAPMYPSSEMADTNDVAAGYIGRNGQMLFELDMIKGMPFSDGLSQVAVKNSEGKLMWGYIDQGGAYVIEPQFINSEPFTEGIAAVAVRDANGNKKWGYIDKSGEFVIQAIFDSAFAFSENLAVIYLDNQGYGYIDRNGQIVIGPSFKMATAFSNGFASVRIDSTEFNCIDKYGSKRFSTTNKLIFEFN